MNALLPIMRCGTPAVAWGAPVIIAATSPFDLPQKEQQNPRAFIFAIMVPVSNLRQPAYLVSLPAPIVSFRRAGALLTVRDNLVN
jgi:hypothetical protein